MERDLCIPAAPGAPSVIVQGPASGFRHAAIAERGLSLWLAGRPGVRRDPGDAAALLEGFAKHGDAIWAEQRGRFVALVRETAPASLRVVTDRWATVPVYRSATAERVALSISLRDGVRAALHPRAWDAQGVAELLTLGQCLRDRTVLAAVRRLPRASVTHFDLERGGESCAPYWSTEQVLGGARERIAAVGDELLARFREAIDLYAADGELYTTLSGGLDTRVIAAALVAGGHRPLALTIGVPGGTDDVVAKRVSRALGIEQRFVAIDAASIGPPLPLLREAALRLDARGLVEGTAVRRMMRELPEAATVFQGAFAELGKLEGAHEVRIRFGRVPAARELPSRIAECFRRNHQSIHEVLSPSQRAQARPLEALAERIRELAERLPPVEALTAFYLDERLEQAVASHALYGTERVAAPFADPFFVETLLRVRGGDRIRPRLHQHFLRRLAPRLLSIRDSNTGLPAFAPGPLRDVGRALEIAALKAGIGWAQAHDDYCAKLARLEPDARTLLRRGRLLADGVLHEPGIEALAAGADAGSEHHASTLQRILMLELWASSLDES